MISFPVQPPRAKSIILLDTGTTLRQGKARATRPRVMCAELIPFCSPDFKRVYSEQDAEFRYGPLLDTDF